MKSLKNREFSFTFSNGSYLRFQSFDDADQLQAFLIKNTPVKIDLGAIYSAKVTTY
jgi:DNA primase small subunit